MRPTCWEGHGARAVRGEQVHTGERPTPRPLRIKEQLDYPGDMVFRHACKRRLGSYYRSGRTQDWLKFKNPEAPTVKREAEENWGS
jgi:hypothetical protein